MGFHMGRAWALLILFLAVPLALGMSLDISSGDGQSQNTISVSYGPGGEDSTNHSIKIDDSDISNHLYKKGPWGYKARSGGALSSIQVTGRSAESWYHLKTGHSITQIWLTVRSADSIIAESYASADGASSKSRADITEATHNASLDYYGKADANKGTLHTEQKAESGVSQSNGHPSGGVRVPESRVGASGSQVIFLETSENANGQSADSEVRAQKPAMPFYEGRADTNSTQANATAYPSTGVRISAESMSIRLRSGDEITEVHALGSAMATGFGGRSSKIANLYLHGPMIASAQSSGPVTINVSGLKLSADLVGATSEYYVGDSSTNKYRMTSEAMGNAGLRGSVATIAGSNATLAGMSISGANYARFEDKRWTGEGIQDVILTSHRKSFNRVNATSSNAKGPIQNCVDLAESGDTLEVSAGTYRENVDIEKSLTINGEGSGTTIVDGNDAGPVFLMGANNSDINVTLKGMTIQNGGETYSFGGGVHNQGGNLTVDHCNISSNTRPSYAGHGGGIHNWRGTAIIQSCNISGNTAMYGGGIFNEYGTVMVEGGAIFNNTAGELGGGIFSGGGVDGIHTLILSGTELIITGNTATHYPWEDWYLHSGGVFSQEHPPILLNDFDLATQVIGNTPPP